MAHVTRAAPPHTDDLPHLTGRTRSPFIPFLGKAPCPRAVPGALLWGYRLSHTGGASKVRGSIGPCTSSQAYIAMSLRGTDMHLGKGLRVTWHR